MMCDHEQQAVPGLQGGMGIGEVIPGMQCGEGSHWNMKWVNAGIHMRWDR